MDTLTKIERSARMRLVKSRNTKPELELRRIVWSLGHRYRKNRRGIIGNPDLAFVGSKRAIFLHGCFWHRHNCPSGLRSPKSRTAFWQGKFARNVERDKKVKKDLRIAGWKSLVVWECELKSRAKVEHRLRKFLDA
jgi:DNA mismatch endonuclease (patch repair protein)